MPTELKSINGGMPKYMCHLSFQKMPATIDKIHAAIELAYKEGEAKTQRQWEDRSCLLSNQDHYVMVTWSPDDAAYQNAYFLSMPPHTSLG